MEELIRDIYLTILNTRTLLYDGKYIQADRRLQSLLTKCAFYIQKKEDKNVDEKNIS